MSENTTAEVEGTGLDARDVCALTDYDGPNRERADFRSDQSAPDRDGVETVATDGEMTIDKAGEILDVPGYTEHVESPEHGGERYVRCEACGRELLTKLGGRDAVTHVEGCPNDD